MGRTMPAGIEHYRKNDASNINTFMEKYYVYEYLRKDGTPYYIGKGTGFRAYAKNRAYKPSDKSRIQIIKENLTEQEAWDYEIELIAMYGRKDLGTGILKNKTDGGEGGSWSEERKLKLSITNKGRTPWNKGLTSDIDDRVLNNSIERSKVRYSEETKKAFRKPKSEQGKANMSLGQKGKKYPKVPCKHCGLLYPSNSMASHLRKHKGDQ